MTETNETKGKSETPPNEIEELVEATYKAQFGPDGKPLGTVESVDSIRKRLEARARVKEDLRQTALKAVGRTDPPSESDPDYLAYGVLADEERTRKFGGGLYGSANLWVMEHGGSALAFEQAARALETWATVKAEPLEAFAARNHSPVVGVRAADLRAGAARLRAESASRLAAERLAAEAQAKAKAEAEAKAKAKRKAEYDRLKALEAEFEGVA